MQTFKAIFTSPTSAERDDPEQTNSNDISTHSRLKRPRTSGERRTRCDVAGLLNMKSAQPRAIAYAAVQVRHMISNLHLALLMQQLSFVLHCLVLTRGGS